MRVTANKGGAGGRRGVWGSMIVWKLFIAAMETCVDYYKDNDLHVQIIILPYSWKIWQFGGLPLQLPN